MKEYFDKLDKKVLNVAKMHNIKPEYINVIKYENLPMYEVRFVNMFLGVFVHKI